jgi:hypothetical protein
MEDFIPRGQLVLHESLDLVGKANFGDSWRGLAEYNVAFDKTIQPGPEAQREEARRRAEDNYSPCRTAREAIRHLLCGTSPEHRDTLTSRMLTHSGETVIIDGHFWASRWEALVVFRTGRIRRSTGETGPKWLGSHGPQHERDLEGPVVVSELELVEAVPAIRVLRRSGSPDAGPQSELLPDSRGSRATWAVPNRGGRPRTYNWVEFAREIIRRANTPDGLPDRATLAKEMAQWCLDTWGKEPSDSMFRDWIAKLYPQ